MKWTNLSTNTFWTKVFDGTQTTTGPDVKINGNTAFFTSIRTVQIRVTYTAKYSQVSNGSNIIVD